MDSAGPGDRATESASPYRADIDGLRALAILLVVVYHVWFGRVSGGVDVFLMISAFFLTASFARRLDAGRRLGVGRYWMRKFRRLLPAAAVTMLGILAASLLVYPSSTWPAIWRQTWASLLYLQNWELAFTNVDYYAREESIPSPLQHFWSLSVQGQVFIIWPLVFLVVAVVARRARLRASSLLVAAFGAIFLASLVFSIVETSSRQSFAYFDTRTRLWEFAAGSLLALLLPRFAASPPVRAVLGWMGLAGIVTCGIALDVQGGFPGYLALWPVLSTAAVILSGSGPSRWGPGALLSSRPLRLLARDAYALYLVHWPVLITWLVVTDRTSVGWLAGGAIIAISLVLARVLAAGVEEPMRRLRRLDGSAWRGAVAVVACVAVVAAPLTLWQWTERARVAALAQDFAGSYPGAMSLLPGADDVPDDVPLWPDATSLDDEWVALDGPCRDLYAPTDPLVAETCAETRSDGWVRDLVVIVGDSHAQQWAGAVLPIAEDQGWDVVALFKGGCSFALEEPPVDGVDDCPQWRDGALAFIEELRPSMVFGMATKSLPESADERALGGLEATVDRLRESGTSVVLFRDNPRFEQNIFFCVESAGPAAPECRRPREAVVAAENPASLVRGADVVDLVDHLCPDSWCLPVIGNVIVYLDHNHLTHSYARTLGPVLAARLTAIGKLG